MRWNTTGSAANDHVLVLRNDGRLGRLGGREGLGRMMVVRVAIAIFVLALAFVASPALAVNGQAPQITQYQQCQADMANMLQVKKVPASAFTMMCDQAGAAGCSIVGSVGSYEWAYNAGSWGSANASRYCYDTATTCAAGQVVPTGSQYTNYPSTGESCSGSCEMALSAGTLSGGQWSGGGNYVLNGSLCLASGTAKSGLSPKPSETTNADGSKTFCDPISGKCVTTKGPTTSPASSSSSGNHSTDSSSVTDTPASSSSSTTTTTTTGTGGDSGSGTGSGSSTSVSNTKTDTLASASSTASKCTTGVCDVGEADGDPGQLYQSSTDTVGSVYATFEQQMSNAPIISAVSGFFSITPSGQCPTWHIPGNQYWGAAGFDFTFFCDSAVLAIMTLAGYVVLAMAAFCATRIAIY